ncbi:COG4315 family predicted lipoprotein [Rhizobium sp. RAF56]|uniref:COG4315 family predicted lipoprotein n=1 Tax=Rhizobium sp. RAF56 TaxID=3233062 RepID=UPI003F94BAC0
MKAALYLPVLILASTAATAAFAEAPVKVVETSKGKVVADAKGMTLYTFKNDKKDMSNCYDDCAKNWPPFMASDNAKADGAYSLVTRKDGKKQWAKDGMPLYLWIKDTKAGDVSGDGVKGVWDAARP